MNWKFVAKIYEYTTQITLWIACSVSWWTYMQSISNDRREDWIMIRMNEWMNKCITYYSEQDLSLIQEIDMMITHLQLICQ